MNEVSEGSIWSRIKPLVFIGWVVVAIRFALEWTESPATLWFGLYIIMPWPLLWFGWKGRFDGLLWGRLALSMLLLSLLLWGLPNIFIYSFAQFQGWTHGRFAPGTRGPPIQAEALGKLWASILVAGGTMLFSSVCLIVFSTLAIWLPRRIRSRRAATG
jgi:hypothetical protein